MSIASSTLAKQALNMRNRYLFIYIHRTYIIIYTRARANTCAIGARTARGKKVKDAMLIMRESCIRKGRCITCKSTVTCVIP